MKSQTEKIGSFEFDLSHKVYLYHPNNKFWQVSLNGKEVTYRVGKFNKQNQQIAVQEVSKQYFTQFQASKQIKQKILQKLTKGYYSKQAINHKDQQKKQSKDKQTQQKLQKKQDQPLIRVNRANQQKNKNQYSGQFYEKGQEQSIKLEVNNTKVKITRICNQKGTKKEGFQIRHFDTNQKAVQFCLEQQAWYISQGYKSNHKKFTYTFIEDEQLNNSSKNLPKVNKKKDIQNASTKASSNYLSITHMTDQAISHRSRATSSCKSDRSYRDDKQDNDPNQYKTSKLGSPTSACIKVLLAETWSDQNDPTGWIMSEKLDGVRCFWTGTMMYSRNGNRFYPPKFFTKSWPKSQLDGQLFIDRGQFSKTISAVKKHVPIDSQWENVKYLVFDAPGLKQTFKKRLQLMQEVIKQIDNDYIKCHYHRECKGYTDLFEQLQKVNKIQGEGLMLRDPNSVYQNKRSKSLLKVKTFHDDQAVVLGYKEGTGRCLGMVGALKVRNTHGVQFEVGSGLTDDQRRKPPKIGTKITYKYQQFNKDSGKPRFPTFLRVFSQKI